MKTFSLIVAALASQAVAMALELPEQIGDYMMLQQQTEARLWGWAKPKSQVNINTSWNNKDYMVKADKGGRWEVLVTTDKASYDEHNIMVSGDGEVRAIEHVLLGEVWFCSGQSNMEMPLTGFWNCPVEGSNETIAQAGRFRKSIRCATIEKKDPLEPADRVPGKWKECTPQNAAYFSANGYYFAETLTQLLDVPVGIINCSWGGSCVEGWLPKEILETYPDGLTPMDDQDYHRKMVMYNGMLHPLAGYTIKGFLWNQGESNVGHEQEYIERFQTMTRLWRKMWRQEGDALPIYTVELPGYSYGDVNGTNCADFRAAQHTIAKLLENSGCVCTADLMLPYEAEQIHGAKKREIGQRMAYLAATRDYGMSGFVSEAPEFIGMKTIAASEGDLRVIAGSAVAKNENEKGKVVCLYFSNCRDGFDRLADIDFFEAAGEDGVWHKATVWADSDWRDPEVNGCFLKLVCPEAGQVKNVRYHYHNFISGGLKGSRGLPIVPFCTHN